MSSASFEQLTEQLGSRFAEVLPHPLRLFHGRGHLHPGLEHVNIDWYPPVLQIILYESVSDERLDWLAGQILNADSHGQVSSILAQRRYLRHSPTQCLRGNIPACIVVDEQGLKFEVQPGHRQNSGLFLDMGPLRQWLRQNSASRSVLNLFAYTCSFSVAAIAGGAEKVVNVDMSRNSLEWGKRNHLLNGHDPRLLQWIPHDLFRSWGRVKQFGPYDVVIIDPPARQPGSFEAEKNYSAVLKRINRLANPSADIIATLNSPLLGRDFLLDLMAEHAPGCQFLDYMPASPEFDDMYPERSLKIYHFRR
jgi:23S rRNA (cytosine1962-C5)-methyltransferase